MSDPSLYAIAQTLIRLRGKIMRHPGYVKGVGANPGDAEFETNQREIDDIRDGLLTAMRYLKSRANHLTCSSRWRSNCLGKLAGEQSSRSTTGVAT